MSKVHKVELGDDEIRELVARYATRGPRYTSYPTAPQWRAAESNDLYRDVLTRYTGAEPVAVYVHIPFCRHLCLYCGCNMRITRRRDLVERYLGAVAKEIDTVADRLGSSPNVAELHFGGGTPTYLEPEELASIIDHIDARLPPASGAERSIEVDPRVTTHDHLAMLRDRGFTRVSAGVQDLDPEVQAAVKREYSEEELRDFVATSRKLGFRGVNLDLIYGLPNQSEASWSRTLASLTDVRPDRLAVYGYAHVPWLKKHQKSLERHDLPGPAQRLAMALQVRRAFIDAGYLAIGMDHFALPSDSLSEAFLRGSVHRNFMGYCATGVDTMIAFGVSSIGDFPDAYVHNDTKLETYCDRIEESGLAIAREHPMSFDDRLRRRLIVRLMGNFVIRPSELERQFDIDFADYFAAEIERLEPFESDGLLEREADGWRATDAGALVIRNVAMLFDHYLEADHATAARYSATI